MSDLIAHIGIGALRTLYWMVLGIGTARMVAEINKNSFSLVYVFLWPVFLCVFAATGRIE